MRIGKPESNKEPLHVRVRPKTLDEVIGQDAVVKALKRRDPSTRTFLFSGPAGTGKTTLGRIIAKGELIEVNGANYTGVDDARNLVEIVSNPSILDPNGKRTVLMDECFTPDTEILTEVGWRKFEDVCRHQDYKVAQWNKGKISFIYPEEYIVRPFKGKLVHLKSDRLIDLFLTPNHQLLTNLQGKWSKQSASAPLSYPMQLPVAGVSKVQSSKITLTPWEQLMIAYQADGYLHWKAPYTSTLEFHFVLNKKIERFLQIMKEGKFDFSEVKAADGKRRFLVTGVERASKRLNQVFSLDRLSHKKAQAILEEMVHWDGHVNQNKKFYFSSAHKSSVDFYQAVAVLAGHKTNVTIQISKNPKHQDVHRLFIENNKTLIGVQNIKKTRVNYEGNVFCVRVPSENIIVRHSGKVLVVGNCHRLTANAWDMLLKPVEEPPPHLYWVFCTTNISKVPKTIQTRC